MTRRQLSSLTIAVIALLAAVLPGFAQAKGSESRLQTPSSLAQTNTEPTRFINVKQIIDAQPRIGAAKTEGGRALAWPNRVLAAPPATFTSQDQLIVEQDEVFFRQQLKAYDNGFSVSRKESREGDREPARGVKRIEFVPSRGIGQLP
jgi:hypothetical protein